MLFNVCSGMDNKLGWPLVGPPLRSYPGQLLTPNGVSGNLVALSVENFQSTAIAEYQRESNMTSMSTA